MRAAPRNLLVVTDLDGTLLDHEYCWEAAKDSVDRLRAAGFPLVLNSSKTLAELLELANQLNTDAPLIAENGGVIAIPDGSELAGLDQGLGSDSGHEIRFLGRSRKEILEFAHALRHEHNYAFEGFADWSDQEIADRTGLSLGQAHQSAERLATEPILWNDSDLRWNEFISLLEQQNIRAIKGGRFVHLMGQADKARAMLEVKRLYTERFPQIDWCLVALGDSPNDFEMLSAADIAVVIPDTNGARLQPKADRVLNPSKPGPAGWQEAMIQILNEHF